MIKINKFENVFGIKKLNGANSLGRINVIYAPNGTAKSSISDAIYNISKNESVHDVYDQLNTNTPSYEIDVDGQMCTENTNISFNVIKYSAVDEYNMDTNLNYSNLAISQNLKNQVLSHINSIETSINNVKSLIEGCFPTQKNKPALLKSLAVIAETDVSDNYLFLKLIKKLDFTIPVYSLTGFTEKDFVGLITEKLKNSSNEQCVRNGVSRYFQITNMLQQNSNIFTNDFKLPNLESVVEAAIKENYFCDTPERKFRIENVVYGENEIKNFIQNQSYIIYGNQQAKEEFENVKKALSGQKTTISILQKFPALVSELVNFNSMVKRLFMTMCDSVRNQLLAELTNIENQQQSIDNLRNNANINDNLLSDIWTRFEGRFNLKNFDLRLENEFNAVAGISFPKFVKYKPGTNDKITDPKLLRFSTGEIRVYNMINFILEVETYKLSQDKVVIILDDAVDSFDYKNKYGIIDYLCDLKNYTNIQLIVFTHNFDFYRSSILAFGKRFTNQYFAYRNELNEINFLDTSLNQNYYLEVVHFNSWKTNPNESKFFALIPFARTIVQLQTNATNVQKLDTYLHYDLNVENYTINDVKQNVLGPIGANVCASFNLNDKYLKKFDEFIQNILSNQQIVNEIDLDIKLAMGLYIRIFLERFLYRTCLANNISVANTNPYARTVSLMNYTLPLFANDTVCKKNILNANLIAPAYVHVNSFMYEPIIDVEAKSLIDACKWLHDKNLLWTL